MNQEIVEDIHDKIDIINMKLEEFKKIQHYHDNLIKRLNYNFRYDLLKVKTYNKIIMSKKNNQKLNKKSIFFRILCFSSILIYCIYTFLIICRYIYS